MSYTEKEVVKMVSEIGDNFNQYKGKVETRFQAYDNQIEALEKYLAQLELPPGGSWAGGARSEFSNLGEFCKAVALSSRQGAQVDPRLLKIQAASGGSEGVPSDGGWLVEKTLMQPLIDGAFQTGLLAPYCFRLPVGDNSNGLKIPARDESSRVTGSRFGGVQAYWAAEAATVTATKPKWRQMELNLHKLFAISYVTDELLQDVTALGTYLEAAFREEMGFKVDDAIIRGTGAGQPLGIINSGCTVSVPKETGQRADTVMFENISKMYSRMLPRSRQRAIWLINQGVENQLFQMTLAVGTGGVPVYLPASGAAGSPYPTLFGRPVVTVEQCEALGDAGDIIFSDLGSYILADKGGIKSAASIHVQFLTDEMTFRWTLRLDGQPMFNSAITPYKGSDDLSPFVMLAAR